MKSLKLVVCLGTFALAMASAATDNGSYRVTLLQPSTIGGTELKPGDYRVDVNGSKATIKAGKQSVEVPVKMEQTDTKTSTTTVRYSTVGGGHKVEEIRVGGTHTKLVFSESGNGSAAAN